jgi:CBS-domain-containing membrane protein
MDTDQTQQNEIDFDKDIDDILNEIENDPDLKIDESEIESILKEIEEENNKEPQEPVFNIDLDAVKKAKDNFNK